MPSRRISIFSAFQPGLSISMRMWTASAVTAIRAVECGRRPFGAAAPYRFYLCDTSSSCNAWATPACKVRNPSSTFKCAYAFITVASLSCSSCATVM